MSKVRCDILLNLRTKPSKYWPYSHHTVLGLLNSRLYSVMFVSRRGTSVATSKREKEAVAGRDCWRRQADEAGTERPVSQY